MEFYTYTEVVSHHLAYPLMLSVDAVSETRILYTVFSYTHIMYLYNYIYLIESS